MNKLKKGVKNTIGNTIIIVMMAILFFTIAMGLSFFIVSGFYWCIAWAFSLEFSWRIAFGVWMTIVLINLILKSK